MLASDVNNQQFTGAMDPDSVMIARFYKRAVHNPFLSEKEGRPFFEDRIYCEYYPAGSTLLRMDVPVHEAHKQRFAKQWAYFQTTQKEDTSGAGTPLSQWAILSPADVENLRGLKFQTIENIAGMSDLQMQSLGMGIAGMSPHVLRARAQAYLGAAQDTAVPQAQAAEIEKLKEQAAQRDAQHKAEMDELRALIQGKAPTAKPKKEKKAKREWTPEQREAARARMQKWKEDKQEAA